MSYQPWGSTITVSGAPGAQNAVVAAIDDGRFIVVWEDRAQTGADSSGSAIRARIYDPFGIPVGESFVVNTTTLGDQARPSISAAPGFIRVSWEDSSATGGDTSGKAVRMQDFDGRGQRVGGEVLVNATTTGDQFRPDGTAFVDAGGEGLDVRVRVHNMDGSLGAQYTGGGPGNQSDPYLVSVGGWPTLAYTSDADANGSIDAIRVVQFDPADGWAYGSDTITTRANGLQGIFDVEGTGSSSPAIVGWIDTTAEGLPEYRVTQYFNTVGGSLSYPVTFLSPGWTVDGMAVATRFNSAREPALVVAAVRDANTATGSVTIAALGSTSMSEQSVLRATAAQTPEVLDADILWDGRVVVLLQETDGRITFQLADGRGASFQAYSAGVVVGADSGPDANNVIGGGGTLYGLGGDDYLYGDRFADLLIGGEGVDVLLGAGGNDTLYGENGTDYLQGQAGTNVLVGGAGVDVLISEGMGDILYGGDGGDYFYAYTAGAVTTAMGEAGNDIFVMQSGPGVAVGGDGQDYFYMGAASDTMQGGSGVDVLQGGGGSDVYDGGSGTDYLFLGSGNDAVLFRAGSGVDVVNGFDPAKDVLRLQGLGVADIVDYDGFVVLVIDADTAIWLIGVTHSQLNAGNLVLA